MRPHDPLDQKERRKRRREVIAIFLVALLIVALTVAEFRLTKVSNTLPFVNSIFFFGLLNINLVLLIAMVWLIARNVGKLLIERRRRLLGARLKTKLVIAFLAFSIIPTLVLFVISAMYINSSFDKWFSIKIQNTLQASLEITRTFYRNTGQTAMHFAEHMASGIGKRLSEERAGEGKWGEGIPSWVSPFLQSQRDLLALDAIEFYLDPLEERAISHRAPDGRQAHAYPRLSLDHLDRAFSGEPFSVIQHIGQGDLIRCLVPVRIEKGGLRKIAGVVAVSSYIPVSLVNKVDEIASVFDDYKDTNPLKYPMKTTYLVILILITSVIIIVAIWVGLYMARELTVPVERLVHGAQQVGAGNLDISIAASGDDEITVLVESFNKMTRDLRESRVHLMKGQREMAWREVARRIAHEIKNPLTPIKLSAQRLQRRMGEYGGREGALLKECTDTIIKHTDELKEMVNEFSNFARFPEITPAPNDLEAALAEVMQLYRQAHGDIAFRHKAEIKIPIFEFDRDQVKRVLINLFDNAVSALKSADVERRSPELVVTTRFNGDLQMAVIEVEDNGSGMPEEVLDRVFEPYFSTKVEGTGLGLAIAKRIVNDHDGFIRVYSIPGSGTRFVIEFPTSGRPAAGRHVKE